MKKKIYLNYLKKNIPFLWNLPYTQYSLLKKKMKLKDIKTGKKSIIICKLGKLV